MENDKIKKSYYSVIPAEVRYCKGLGKPNARDLYGEISSLTNERGYCWATNKYLADSFEVEERSIQRWLNRLEKNNFIYVDNTGARRKIFIIPIGKIDQPEAPKKEPKKTIKKDGVNKYSDKDLELAELLLSKIIQNFSLFENRKVDITKWAEDIRKLREIDGATAEQIEFMIYWVHGGQILKGGRIAHDFKQHEFWSQNIMSASKLRKQWYENLIPKLQEALKKTIKKNSVGKLS